jgi:hypothetical protein
MDSVEANSALSPPPTAAASGRRTSVALRAVLVTLPILVTDIIEEIVSRHIVLEVAAELPERDSLEQAISSLAPDVVFIGLRPGENDAIGADVLKIAPNAKVIAISSHSRNAYLYEMQPHREALVEFTPKMLVDALLDAGSETDSDRKLRH